MPLITASSQSCQGIVGVNCKRVGERGLRCLARVCAVRKARRILIDSLVIIKNGVIVDQDLEAVAVVVDSDRVVRSDKRSLQRHPLLTTPATTGGHGVERNCVLESAKAYSEQNVIGCTQQIDAGIVNGTANQRRQVQRGGLEDRNAIRFELIFEFDGLGEGK